MTCQVFEAWQVFAFQFNIYNFQAMANHLKLIALLLCFANGLAAQTITGSIQHNGIQRDYRLHLPPNLLPGSKPPLVFNLHGFTSNATQQETYSDMNAVADTAGFIVCYPNGIGNAWNIGVAGGSTADDLGFIATLIDSFHAQYGIDRERVYSCGMSNGGFFSYRLACEMSDRIAAIASVTGSMTNQLLNNCNPARPVPVLEIHGTADPLVAYNGAMGNAGIPAVIAGWAAQNGCIGQVLTGSYPDVVASDQTTANFEIHAGCEEDVEVKLITIQNGGHTWPGAFPTVIFGATCQDFDASVEIWNFFNRFKLNLASSVDHGAPQLLAATVFPNPFDHHLNILLDGKSPDFARVFDAFGRLVWQGVPAAGVATEAWPAGMYLLEIKMGDETLLRKAVKH